MEFLFAQQLEVEKARCNGTSKCNSGNWPVGVEFRPLPLRQACRHLILDGYRLARVAMQAASGSGLQRAPRPDPE